MSHSSTRTSAPRLLDQVREIIRIKHYCIRTEQAYMQWIRRYILYHDKRHPKDMGATEVSSDPSVLQRAIRQAVRDAQLVKPASVHTLRHFFATAT